MGHVVSGGPAVMSPTQVLASCLCQPQCWLKERGALLSPSVEFFNRLAPSVVHRAACYYFVDSWIVLFSCSRIWPKLPKGVSPVSPSVTSQASYLLMSPFRLLPSAWAPLPRVAFPVVVGGPHLWVQVLALGLQADDPSVPSLKRGPLAAYFCRPQFQGWITCLHLLAVRFGSSHLKTDNNFLNLGFLTCCMGVLAANWKAASISFFPLASHSVGKMINSKKSDSMWGFLLSANFSNSPAKIEPALLCP